VTPARSGGSGQLGIEVDEHRTRKVAGEVVVVTAGRTERPADVEEGELPVVGEPGELRDGDERAHVPDLMPEGPPRRLG
jgi:hypothetical protein